MDPTDQNEKLTIKTNRTKERKTRPKSDVTVFQSKANGLDRQNLET
jgi:hypothetical protein